MRGRRRKPRGCSPQINAGPRIQGGFGEETAGGERTASLVRGRPLSLLGLVSVVLLFLLLAAHE